MWTSAQKSALEQQFAKNIRLEKVPGKLECINSQRECSVLSILPGEKKNLLFTTSSSQEKTE